MSSGEPPKIIVDDDWKREAQAEKERLARQEAARTARPAPGAQDEPEGPIAFDDVLKMLATQALMYMGAFPDPQSGRAVVAPDYAKVYIDMLGVLEEKTKGNLSAEEEQNLKSALYELRLQFVELSKAVAKAIQEGRISPSGGAAGGLGGGLAGGAAGGLGMGGIAGPGGSAPLR